MTPITPQAVQTLEHLADAVLETYVREKHLCFDLLVKELPTSTSYWLGIQTLEGQNLGHIETRSGLRSRGSMSMYLLDPKLLSIAPSLFHTLNELAAGHPENVARAMEILKIGPIL